MSKRFVQQCRTNHVLNIAKDSMHFDNGACPTVSLYPIVVISHNYAICDSVNRKLNEMGI